MFVCDKCKAQSQPGVSPVIVPTVTRPVLYQYVDGRSYMGDEWVTSAALCDDCWVSNDALLLRTVKTVEVPCKVNSARTEMR
jgi:hypothetical protein